MVCGCFRAPHLPWRLKVWVKLAIRSPGLESDVWCTDRPDQLLHRSYSLTSCHGTISEDEHSKRGIMRAKNEICKNDCGWIEVKPYRGGVKAGSGAWSTHIGEWFCIQLEGQILGVLREIRGLKICIKVKQMHKKKIMVENVLCKNLKRVLWWFCQFATTWNHLGRLLVRSCDNQVGQ